MQNQIPKNWQKVKLGEVVDITSSKRIFAREYLNSGIPFYRGKEIIEKFVGSEVSTDLYISQQKYDEIKSRFGVPQSGDMLLTSVGTLGVPYLVGEVEKFYFKDGNLTWFRKYNGINNKFLYYWILSPLGKGQLVKHIIGSSQQALTIDGLKKIEIDLPPINIQNQISSILSVFDDKIEVNNKIAKTLEEMAQALFKEWFVHFRFPGYEKAEFVDSELGRIPKGWVIKSLPEIAQVIDCLHIKIPPRQKDGQILLQVFNIGKNGLLETNEYYFVDNSDYKTWTKNIEVQRYDCVISNAGRVGAIAQIPEGFIAGIGRNMTAVRPEKVTPTYLFNYFFSDYGKKEIDFHTDFSTVFASLNVRGIKKFRTLIPPLDIMQSYETLAKPMQDKRWGIQKENQKLAAFRDLLLPKLMKGEIRV